MSPDNRCSMHLCTTSTRLYGATSQKAVVFILATVRNKISQNQGILEYVAEENT
jgi:hypothetical protein